MLCIVRPKHSHVKYIRNNLATWNKFRAINYVECKQKSNKRVNVSVSDVEYKLCKKDFPTEESLREHNFVNHC